jgi:hypothetical protein
VLTWIKLRILAIRKGRLESSLQRELAKARNEGEMIPPRQFHPLGMVDQRIEILHTQALIRKADRLHIAHPPEEEWEVSNFFDQSYLNEYGYAKLRSAVRTEQKERREAKSWIITAVTGLGGVIVAVLALLLKMRSP